MGESGSIFRNKVTGVALNTMKEVFRDRDYTRVSLMKTLLETEGIPVIMRNELLATSGITEIPIPEFFPNLCVFNDEDYSTAWSIIDTHLKKESDSLKAPSIRCSSCKEENPGNFEFCWNCESDLASDS